MLDIVQKDPMDLIAIGREAIRSEANALVETAQQLGSDYVEAVKLLARADGRVIISGMGKSGHVGRKIAATLSSVGCPAYFVHPSEASHGDLGMIVKNDVLLALSNSGNTSELSDIIAYCQQQDVPVISITGERRSRLAVASTIALTYPKLDEVCAVGLAPTTSTTVMMALGDAIAVGVMNLLGTTAEHFGRIHPGGKLGARMMKVDQLMHVGDSLPVVAAKTPMRDVILTISQKGFGTVIVCDEEQRVIGVITDGDMRRNIETLWESAAETIAHRDPILINQSTLAVTALQQMTKHKISALPVVNNGSRLVGLVHIHDCLRAGL